MPGNVICFQFECLPNRTITISSRAINWFRFTWTDATTSAPGRLRYCSYLKFYTDSSHFFFHSTSRERKKKVITTGSQPFFGDDQAWVHPSRRTVRVNFGCLCVFTYIVLLVQTSIESWMIFLPRWWSFMLLSVHPAHVHWWVCTGPRVVGETSLGEEDSI